MFNYTKFLKFVFLSLEENHLSFDEKELKSKIDKKEKIKICFENELEGTMIETIINFKLEKELFLIYDLFENNILRSFGVIITQDDSFKEIFSFSEGSGSLNQKKINGLKEGIFFREIYFKEETSSFGKTFFSNHKINNIDLKSNLNFLISSHDIKLKGPEKLKFLIQGELL